MYLIRGSGIQPKEVKNTKNYLYIKYYIKTNRTLGQTILLFTHETHL